MDHRQQLKKTLLEYLKEASAGAVTTEGKAVEDATLEVSHFLVELISEIDHRVKQGEFNDDVADLVHRLQEALKKKPSKQQMKNLEKKMKELMKRRKEQQKKLNDRKSSKK